MIILLMSGCGGSSEVGGTSSTTDNVLSITVNGSLCSNNSYPNKPCVSVTICTPGTLNCQTINDLLLDTGDSGLRIFKQALNIPLTQVVVDSRSLAECVQFGDGSSEWGPIQKASVILGNEPAILVPVQVVDSTFGTVPSSCGIPLAQPPYQDPAQAGYNGSLGVGLFAQDCGSACLNSAHNGQYYSCSGSNCNGTTVPLSSQVQNPVALLPQDNNGVIVQLPSVPLGGSPSVNGSLVLGIGTRANNLPSGVTAYAVDDQYGEFTTTFEGSSLTGSFIDTGSNGLFFSSKTSSYNLTGLLPDCATNSGWFCPSSTVSFSAVNTRTTGPPSGTVNFQIGNTDSLFSSPTNNVFVEIGGDGSGGFDWGLPFHFGRNVYIGIEGTSSGLGSGPYFAY